MKKRTILIVLALVMTVSMFAACQGSTSPSNSTAGPGDEAATQGASSGGDSTGTPDATKYAEKLTFTVASLDYPEGFDDYPLVVEAKKRFNIDFQVQHVAYDTWDETIRTAAATNTLPEVVAWYNLNFPEYKAWAEQGVLKAFPEDMSPWPNLKANLDKLAVTPYLMVDGKLYCSPKIDNNQPVNHFSNTMMKYRRDWAEAMGYKFGSYQELTLDEYLKYLRDLKAKDPGKIGEKLIPCETDEGGNGWVSFVRLWNGHITDYYKKDDGTYEWGARDPSSLEGIKMMNTMYKEGLLYRDDYADTDAEGRFEAGLVGSQWGAVAIHELTNNVNALKNVVDGFNDEDIGSMSIRMPDGKFHLSLQRQYWAAFAFSNNCSQEIMERWLDVGNWLMDTPQIETYAYGVLNQDWTKDANGKVTVNWTADEIAKSGPKYYIAGERFFQKFFMLEGADLWLEGNPALRPVLKEDVFLNYFRSLGEAEERGEVVATPIDFDIEFVSGANKDQYGTLSAQIRDAIIQAVVSDDPEGVWNKFLSDSKPQVDAVLKEINDALSK